MSAGETNHGFTAEELDLLTPEEREALLDPEPDAAEQDALRRLAAGAGDDDDDGGDDDAGQGGEAAAPAPAPAPSPAPAAPAPAATPAAPAPAAQPASGTADGDPGAAAAPAPEPESAPAPVAPRAPIYQAEMPADYQERMDAVQTSLKELRDKFKAGTMELEDYEVRREELAAQADELKEIKTKVSIAREMAEQQVRQEEQTSLRTILARAAKEGVDYNDQKLAGAFDRYWRFLAEDPDWAGRPIADLHAEAHKHVLGRLGKTSASAAPPAPAQSPAVPAARKAPTAVVPPSLAHVPGADGPGDVQGEFADLDGLEGLDLEDAIARLSPAQRDKYMAGR